MSGPPPGSHMEWHPPSGPHSYHHPYGPPSSPYDAPPPLPYNHRGPPPMTPYPPPYTPQGPRGMPPPPQQQKYSSWYEGPPRRGGPYGGPYMSYEGPPGDMRPPPLSHMRGGYGGGGEGRPYGPPPDYYPPRPEGYAPPPPPAFRTPQRGPAAALVQTSSFSSSKEETPDVAPPQKNSDWEPTRSTVPKKDPKKQGGDPLSFLAKVAMAPPQDEAKVTTHIAHDSPARLRSSPIITPHSSQRDPPPPAQYYREPHGATPKPITPTTTHYGPRPNYDSDTRGPNYYNAPSYAPPPPSQYSYPSGYDSRAASWEQPAVVVEERSSFDSLESAQAQAPYPPPHRAAWGSPYPPPPQWYNAPYETPPYAPPRLMPHRGYYDDPRVAYRGPPPPYGPPPSAPRDEKTVLRKKFSWKHFPELERFLIDNRDDYLKFSSRNYTVEQKQFNNLLTERLIALAEQHGFIFDPEDFNFVAIRDRIRCYYKSYVQTARKRGLLLPSAATTTTATEEHGDDDTAPAEEDVADEDAEEAAAAPPEAPVPPAEAEVRE